MPIVNVADKNFYMDGYLKKNLDFVKDKVIHRVNMFTCIVSGRSGSGKSTAVGQWAYYLSNGKFGIDQETFTPQQFMEGLETIDKGNSLVLDEAFAIMNKRKTLSSQNMIGLSMLQQARIKQCFIFIVLPSMYDLDKNLILNIADLHIRCYRKPFGRRGQFCVYNRKRLKNLWLHCRQSYSYSPKIAKANFRGRFTKFFPLDIKAYEKKKALSLKSLVEEQKREGGKYIDQRNKLIRAYKEENKSVKDICGITGLKQRTIYDIINKEDKAKVVEIEEKV